MSRAYAVKGAVIISDDGTHVKYHPHCDKCGYTLERTTGNGHVGECESAYLSTFYCPKCGTINEIKINRGC